MPQSPAVILDNSEANVVPSTIENAGLRTIQLTPAEFWQLRALMRDVQAIESDLIRARDELNRRLREAIERRDRHFADLAARYGLHSDGGQFQCDDATCTLREA